MYNNYHRSQRADVQQQQHMQHGSYQQSFHSTRLKLSSFKGKSWQSFEDTLTSESSDDETDNEDPLALPLTSSSSSPQSRHNRASIVRLKRRDIPLYGYCPETEPFAVVSCRHCRKILKSTALKRHIDMRHDPMVKLEKIPEKYGNIEKIEKIKDAVEKISVTSSQSEKTASESSSQKRHRHVQRKSTPPDNSNDVVPMQIETPPQPQPPPPPPTVPKQQPTSVIPQPSESSSASNSPQPRRKKRKPTVEPSSQSIPIVTTVTSAPPPPVTRTDTETFQTAAIVTPSLPVPQQPQPVVVTSAAVQQTLVTAAAAPTTCRIIMSSSPPPLAPITTSNEAPPSVWIVTPSPAVIIDGSFVVKPLETEIDTEIDLKDLKVLKPAIKEQQVESSTQLTASNWYTTQPRPLALNTFN